MIETQSLIRATQICCTRVRLLPFWASICRMSILITYETESGLSTNYSEVARISAIKTDQVFIPWINWNHFIYPLLLNLSLSLLIWFLNLLLPLYLIMILTLILIHRSLSLIPLSLLLSLVLEPKRSRSSILGLRPSLSELQPSLLKLRPSLLDLQPSLLEILEIRSELILETITLRSPSAESLVPLQIRHWHSLEHFLQRYLDLLSTCTNPWRN